MKLRLFTFVCVGVFCLLLQILLLTILRHYTHVILANGIGFVASAQINFILSYHITWRDSQRQRGGQLWATWVKFNLVVLGSACINSAAFAALRYTFITVDELAAIAAVIVSTVFTFSVNHFIVFKPKGVLKHWLNILRQSFQRTKPRGAPNGSTSRNSNVPASME